MKHVNERLHLKHLTGKVFGSIANSANVFWMENLAKICCNEK